MKSVLKDLNGRVFGNLKVLRRAPDKIAASGRSHTMWTCLCCCGKVYDVASSSLLNVDVED